VTRGRPGDVGVLLLAAGSGSRFGEKKQFLRLAGKPLFLHSLEVFESLDAVGEIVVVAAADDIGQVRELVDRRARPGRDSATLIEVVAGGARRQDSVRSGLRALATESTWTLVHDAARPLVRADDVSLLIAVMREHGAAVMGYLASDSVKEEADGVIVGNVARDHVWLVQTPQGARTERLLAALDEAESNDVAVTDEASALENLGDSVALVDGARDNIKVTYRADLDLAEFFLHEKKAARRS